MLFLRVIGILTAITIGSSVLAWLLTHEPLFVPGWSRGQRCSDRGAGHPGIDGS